MLAVDAWPGTVIHDASGDLFTVDLDGGMAVAYVGTTDLEMFDMAFSPLGELYGVNNPWWGPSELYTFEVDFGTPSVTTNLRGTITMGQGQGIYVNSLAFNQAGELFAAGSDQQGRNYLFKVDPDTAGAERVLALDSYQSAGDLAFDSGGNLFLTTLSGELLRISPAMDSFAVVGQTQFLDFLGLTYGPAPLMYAFRQGRGVYQVNPADGVSTLVAQLAHPQLDLVYGAATVFPPPTDLGEVDFRDLPNQEPTLGELWYRVQPTRDAVLTVALPNVDPASQIALSLYQFDTLGELDQLPTQNLGNFRLDYESPVPGAEYFVKIEGAETNVDVRVANLVKPTGNGAMVYGTDENDTFTFRPGPPYTVMINGVNYPYNFNSNFLVTVTFDGGIGHDVANMTGSTGVDVATLSLASFSGNVTRSSRYRVVVSGTPEMTFDGAGGNDSASLVGSIHADTVTLRPKFATVAGLNSLLRVTGVPTISINAAGGADSATFTGTTSNETADLRYLAADFRGTGGFSTSVSNVESISADAGGGFDTAAFSDSPQPDTFEATPAWASMTGPGFSLWAGGYDEVVAQATLAGGGTDTAKLYGNRRLVDTFEGRPYSSTLSGNGFSNRVESFRYVHAYGTEGNGDVALLYDRAGTKDGFDATPTYARLYGDDFYNRALQFDEVHGYGTPGDADVAKLYDDPGAKDTYRAWPDRAELVGAGFDNEAVSFRYVYAYGTEGNGDVALLYDRAGTKDTFLATPSYARLYGGNFYNQALQFDEAHGYGTAGDADLAKLYDDPGAKDTYRAWPDRAELVGAGFDNEAVSFGYVYAFGTPVSQDEAHLYDDPNGPDTFQAWPTEARLYGNGFYNQAKLFRYVYGYATEGGGDVARLYDDPKGPDTFEAWPDEARLSGKGFSNQASLFRYVYGYATAGGNDVAHLYDSVGKDTFRAWPDQAKMAGNGFFNQANSFRTVNGYSTAGGIDKAFLYDSALDQFPDYLEADANWAHLSNNLLGYEYWVREFEEVTANSSNPSDTKNVDPNALDFILNGEEGW